jgi:hypothetical protein
VVFVTADQLLLHAVGDYLLQSHWMATAKTSRKTAALAHALVYTGPFWFLTQSWAALLFIFGTHFVIDHWRLARYVCWSKNFLAPPGEWPASWKKCSATGYDPSLPAWLAIWLMIIADNTMHIICNAAALRWF